MEPVRVGVIGCGMISAIYLQNCTQRFENLEVVACADLVPDLARSRAAEFGVPKACSVDELLADPAVEAVLNLTLPTAHTDVNLRALAAGKHVYAEKPFALTLADADRVLAEAAARGLRVGIAPDTFLGGGLQSCRSLLASGAVGSVYGASGLILMGNAYDGMHPRFETYFQPGWDPLFDMAPYYLTALALLLGPVRRVSGAVASLRSQVTVTNPRSPRVGETVPVLAPQHGAATLEFAAGPIATLQAAKESAGYLPRLEVYGTEGVLQCNDPNMFGGQLRVRRNDGAIEELRATHGFTENSRGLGLADMARAIREGGPHRASGALARHILEVTLAIFESARSGARVDIAPPAELPEPMPVAA